MNVDGGRNKQLVKVEVYLFMICIILKYRVNLHVEVKEKVRRIVKAADLQNVKCHRFGEWKSDQTMEG